MEISPQIARMITLHPPRVYYVRYIPAGYTAITLPPFGIFIHESQRGNKTLLLHELVHWCQYLQHGLIGYYAGYLADHARYGYDRNPWEIEARIKSGEAPKNWINYTDAVRSGNSLTVYNPLFKS